VAHGTSNRLATEVQKGNDAMILLRRKIIYRHDHTPYLWRLTIVKCRSFSVMLHHFLSSDDDCLHDHPWPFVSIILRGGYWEFSHRFEQDGRLCSDAGRWYGPGSVLARRANWAHRIEIDHERPCWTLVITGARWREWGFFTKFGWIHWRRYSHARDCA
jgi:hypothetical protein